MLIRSIITEATQIWSKSGGKNVRKYRCTSGARKGRVMASPASCSKPLHVGKSTSLKKTRTKRKQSMSFKSGLAKRSNPSAIRTQRLNKSSTKSTPRKANTRRSRRIK